MTQTEANEMRIIWPNGDDANTVTTEQSKAVERIAKQYNLSGPIEVSPDFLSDCVLLQVPGMILGIESDGYIHS